MRAVGFFIMMLFLLLSAPVSSNYGKVTTKYPNVINIGIYHAKKISSILVSPVIGGYEVYCGEEKIITLNNGEGLTLIHEDGKIHLKTLNSDIGIFSSIRIVRNAWGCSFKVKPIAPKLMERQFYDDLYVYPLKSGLQLLNHVYIEHYIAGVVESEAGGGQNKEYYKVQSIICRTYALANLKRHANEGFNVCDEVHCQVYIGRSRHKEILEGTKETKGVVLTDSDINLITAGFHSNCGGQTLNSEDVWKSKVSYLRSVCDTFCTDMPHALWDKAIPLDAWLKYLNDKFKYPVEDTLFYSCAVDHQPIERQTVLNYLDSTIFLTQIRKDWGLRSTQFILEERNDTIHLKGYGFGHGVGLCQEGAMKMSKSGYTYSQILHFYYQDVHLVDVDFLDFFRGY